YPRLAIGVAFMLILAVSRDLFPTEFAVGMIPSALDDLAVCAGLFACHQRSANCPKTTFAMKKKHVRRFEGCPMPATAAVLHELQLLWRPPRLGVLLAGHRIVPVVLLYV
ncbi:MAG: hypothetical protein DMF91_21740, partial [Acidobacteria bacterium]